MSNARNLAKLIVDANGDIGTASLDNVPPSNDASALTTGTLPIERIADTSVTAAKLHTTAVTDKLGYTPVNKAGDTVTGNLTISSDGTSSSGNFFGSARGREMSLSTSWTTFATLRGATGVGIRLKVISGHNSGVNTYYEANSDTYSYNIANGTVVTFTTGSGNPGTCSVRKVKNNSYGGDGGWDYQIVAASPYGTLAWIDVFGTDTSWEWKI